jgi:hypothetical protein
MEPMVSQIVETALSDSVLESLVLEEIRRLTTDGRSDKALQEASEVSKRLARHQAALRKASYERTMVEPTDAPDAPSDDALANAEQLEALDFAIEQHSRSIVECKRRLGEIGAEAERALRLRQSVESVGARVGRLRCEYEDATGHDRKRVLGMIIESVRVIGSTRKIEIRVRAAA